jgi:hypothetical protein
MIFPTQIDTLFCQKALEGAPPSQKETASIQKENSKLLPRKIKVNRWTKEEDEWLLNGIKTFGTNWKIFINHYPAPAERPIRKATQCYDRYRYWKKLYSLEEIQSIEEPIRVVILDNKRGRRIANLFQKQHPKTTTPLIQKETDEKNVQEIAQTPPSKCMRQWIIDEDSQQTSACREFLQASAPFGEEKNEGELHVQKDSAYKSKYGLHWSLEEDERLLNGIKNFGTHWTKIADVYFKASPGSIVRTPSSCYDRYRKYWQRLYSVEEIQSIAEPIEVITLKGSRERRITHLFLISVPETQGLETVAMNNSIIPETSSHTAQATLENNMATFELDQNVFSPISHLLDEFMPQYFIR